MLVNTEFRVSYLVYGVFLQDFAALVDAQERQIMDKRQVYQPNPEIHPFRGYIYPTLGLRTLEGQLRDRFGKSTITDIQISDDTFSFKKVYRGRNPDTEGIPYYFVKADGLWIGQYSNSAVGTGRAECVLYEVRPEMFYP